MISFYFKFVQGVPSLAAMAILVAPLYKGRVEFKEQVKNFK